MLDRVVLVDERGGSVEHHCHRGVVATKQVERRARRTLAETRSPDPLRRCDAVQRHDSRYQST
jgi:hypothetical protein